MHEWALAEAIIRAVTEMAEEEHFSEVTEVEIKLGELQQIEPKILEFAVSQMKAQKLTNTRFRMEMVKAKLRCRMCGHESIFKKGALDKEKREAIHFVPEVVHAFVKCPDCGSSDLEILQGRGVWLENVRGVK